MSKPVIAIKLSPKNYSGLVNLGNTILAAMTGNLSYTTPAPPLSSLQSAITNVENAIAAWGPKGNRGSHQDLVDLRTKALTLRDMLKAEAQYVQNTAQITAGTNYAEMAAIITSSGYQLSNVKTPQGILQMVQNFHNFVSRKINSNQIKLKWKKPLNTTSAGNVKSYTILKGATSVVSAAIPVAFTTKTSFIYTNDAATPQTLYFWVIPVNTAGEGVVSDVVAVTIPNA